MPLAEYIYIDDSRLDSYFEQISPPIKYEKMAGWNVELSVAGPKAQRHESTSGRTFTRHEKVEALVLSLRSEYPDGFPTAMDAVKPSATGTWAGFALETVMARRVLLHDADFGNIPIWVCEATFEHSMTDEPLWRFLIEDYPRSVGNNNLACVISTYSFLFTHISSQARNLNEASGTTQTVDSAAISSHCDADVTAGLMMLLARARLGIGPLRKIDVLYRVRDVGTQYVASGGCGELYGYLIFIAEHPSPLSGTAIFGGLK